MYRPICRLVKRYNIYRIHHAFLFGHLPRYQFNGVKTEILETLNFLKTSLSFYKSRVLSLTLSPSSFSSLSSPLSLKSNSFIVAL